MKKIRFLALLLAAAFVFSGCNLIAVNPERDGAQIVAEVSGETITKKQVYDTAGIKWGIKIEAWELDDYKQKKEEALEGLIQIIVEKQKYRELGYYTFNEEERKAIDDAMAEYRTSEYDKLLADFQEQAKADPSINPEERAGAAIADYKQRQEDYKAADKAWKAITDTVAPTDAEISKQYDDILAQQKTSFDQDPSQIYQYDNYVQFGYPPILYYPVEGLFRVKHILVPLPDDVQAAIAELRKDNTKANEADQKRAEELKKIEAAANEALTKAQAASGDLEKLNALITELGKDPGMTAEHPGYLMSKDSENMVREFTAAAAALTDIGKPSGLVGTDYGYHILWLTEKIAKGDVPFDAVKDKIADLAKSSKQNEAWQAAVTGWMDEYKTKIKRYTSRLHN